jgi:hypothetical protein
MKYVHTTGLPRNACNYGICFLFFWIAAFAEMTDLQDNNTSFRHCEECEQSEAGRSNPENNIKQFRHEYKKVVLFILMTLFLLL